MLKKKILLNQANQPDEQYQKNLENIEIVNLGKL